MGTDVETPKSVEVKAKADDLSISTHQSDSDSDISTTPSEHKSTTRTRKIAIAIVAGLLLGAILGTGLGLKTGRAESKTSSLEAEEAPQPVVSDEEQIELEQQPGGDQNAVDIPIQDDESPGVLPEEGHLPSKPPPMSIGGGGLNIGMGEPDIISWPQLVGIPVEEAKKIIEDEDQGYTVRIVPPGGITTKDYRRDRVFIFSNEQGLVEREPRPG